MCRLSLRLQREACARILVAHKCKVNDVAADGCTALHLAIRSRDEFAAVFLVRNGGDVNARITGSGASPLHLAVESGQAGVAGTILAQRADVNAQDATGATPLHWSVGRTTTRARERERVCVCDDCLPPPPRWLCASWPHVVIEVLSTLLFGHRCCEQQRPRGEDDTRPSYLHPPACTSPPPPLLLSRTQPRGRRAIRQTQPDLVKLLLTQPALNLALADAEEKTAFALALLQRDFDSANAIKRRDPSAVEQRNRCAGLRAASLARRLLVAAAAKLLTSSLCLSALSVMVTFVTCVASRGQSYLHTAIARSDEPSVRFLLDVGVDVNGPVQVCLAHDRACMCARLVLSTRRTGVLRASSSGPQTI